MKNRSLALLVASMLIVITVVPVAMIFDDHPRPMESIIVEEDSYGNYVLSIRANDLLDNDYQYGDYVALGFGDFNGYAIFLPDFSACHPYELVLVGKGTDYLTVASFNCDLTHYFPADIGDTVRLHYDSHTTRLQDYPCMSAGYIQQPVQGMTDEDFANFRCIDLNGFKIYRSISPIHSYSHSEEKIMAADRMYQKYGITYDIHMGVDQSKAAREIDSLRDKHIADNYISLYDSGRVICSYCNSDTVTYAQHLRNVIIQIIDHPDEKLCVHCNMGKDRTGFLFMLLESIAGWSEEEIINDYVQAFLNIYGIEKGSREHQLLCSDYFKHTAFMMQYPDSVHISFAIDWDYAIHAEINYHDAAERFLLDYVGLTQDELQRLKDLIC